jgi:hypothetical protein
MIMYIDVVGYNCFGGPCCLHVQGEVNDTGKGSMNVWREYKRGNACVGHYKVGKDSGISYTR